MKCKGKIYAYLYIAIVLVFFIFVVCLTVKQTAPTSDAIGEQSAKTTTASSTVTPADISIDEPILYSELKYSEFDSVENAEMFIDSVDIAVDELAAECSISDKYTTEATALMLEEIDRLTAERTNAMRQKERMIKWVEKEEEYYYATCTWKYLKSLGYSDVACAGILGNLMAECGGHTLNLNPYLYDKATGKYYGMFQWSIYYYPDIEGGSFEEQLAYYAETSDYVFKTFGKKYAEGFTLDDFNELKDPREAALAFAKIYERCASWTY